jgi:pyruvate dehydrogenase E2 component (dihydrolipoamide acetyltransferase)
MATEVLVPPLGQTVDTLVLVSWHKQEGDTVTQGEPLFAIETDKATLDVEAPASGILRCTTAKAGEEVKVLSKIAVIVQQSEELSAATGPAPAQPAFAIATAPAQPAQTDIAALRKRIFISPRARRLAEQEQVPLEEVKATGPEGAIIERDVRAHLERPSAPPIAPVARRMAEEAGLDWRNLAGSGVGGRVMRKDITQAIAQAAQVASALPATAEKAAPPPIIPLDGEPLETIPVSGVRAVIAERMASSHGQTAPVTLTMEADATALVELRRQLAQDGLDVSYNDLLLYILARALREHPQVNASLDGNSIKVWQRVDIGLAVDTDRGLLVPVVRNVDCKGLQQIAQETNTLAERARTGQCTPDELRGGTFTLTNLGMFGIDAFTPIINLPECAILGVGRIKMQPVMADNNTVVGRQMVWLSLTFDHRLVDGGPAARFLQRVAQLVERPHLLIT